jgi:PWI domain
MASRINDYARAKKPSSIIKFAPHLKEEVDLNKVHRAILSQWIETTITGMLGIDDEIVTQTAIHMFLPESNPDSLIDAKVDPCQAQMDLVGFLGEDNAAKFVSEVWKLMLEAQTSPQGIPWSLIEAKKKELEKERQASRGSMMRYREPRYRGPPPPVAQPVTRVRPVSPHQFEPSHDNPQVQPQMMRHDERYNERRRPSGRPSRWSYQDKGNVYNAREQDHYGPPPGYDRRRENGDDRYGYNSDSKRNINRNNSSGGDQFQERMHNERERMHDSRSGQPSYPRDGGVPIDDFGREDRSRQHTEEYRKDGVNRPGRDDAAEGGPFRLDRVGAGRKWDVDAGPGESEGKGPRDLSEVKDNI